MRKPLFLLLSFVLIIMTARGVSASTDCQRWLADYKKALADKAGQPRLLAAKHRVRAYARRKIALLTSPAPAPKPSPTRIASTHPHLTPAQMLKRFEVLCGDLPVEPAPAVLDARMAPDDFISEMAAAGPVDTDTLPSEDTLVAENAPPYYDSPSVDLPNVSTPGSYFPSYGPLPGGFSPGTVIVPPVTPPVTPPVAPVPEPATFALFLSGSAGLVKLASRRLA